MMWILFTKQFLNLNRSATECGIMCENSNTCTAFMWDLTSLKCSMGIKGNILGTKTPTPGSIQIFTKPGKSESIPLESNIFQNNPDLTKKGEIFRVFLILGIIPSTRRSFGSVLSFY